MKKRINSINKGKRFERLVAKILSEKLGVPFQRTAQSGAFATVNGLKMMRGDIFTEHPAYKDLVVECKFRRDAFKIEEFFLQAREDNLNGFLAQTWDEAGCDETLGQKPNWILFVKSNGHNILFFTFNQEIADKISPRRKQALILMDTKFIVGML